jgi:hypothetical protein
MALLKEIEEVSLKLETLISQLKHNRKIVKDVVREPNIIDQEILRERIRPLKKKLNQLKNELHKQANGQKGS